MTNKIGLGLDFSEINLKKLKIYLILIILFELTCLLLKLKLKSLYNSTVVTDNKC